MAVKKVEVRQLKKGRYVMIDDEPCKIVEYTTSSPGKHGSAKARIVAVGLFDGKKRTITKPVDAKIEVPVIERKTAQVVSDMGDTIQLMDMETYETFEVPKPEDEELVSKLEPGVLVEYMEAAGKRKIVGLKEED
ncbi:MAG: translation initiation factor IF-5A [Methanopyri archaeon]|nr:translation initiation factor IF-5A [Methanopyri archaeon]